MHTPISSGDFTPLIRFRQQAYDLLDHRKDAFFELLDAVLQTPAAHSFAELTLAPACQRQWHSSYKALQQVTYDQQGLDELCLAQVPDDGVAHFAIAVTSARRMRSPTLLERQYCHGAARAVNGTGGGVGLPYSILAWTSARGSSFAPPVNLRRARSRPTGCCKAWRRISRNSARPCVRYDHGERRRVGRSGSRAVSRPAGN